LESEKKGRGEKTHAPSVSRTAIKVEQIRPKKEGKSGLQGRTSVWEGEGQKGRGRERPVNAAIQNTDTKKGRDGSKKKKKEQMTGWQDALAPRQKNMLSWDQEKRGVLGGYKVRDVGRHANALPNYDEKLKVLKD